MWLYTPAVSHLNRLSQVYHQLLWYDLESWARTGRLLMFAQVTRFVVLPDNWIVWVYLLRPVGMISTSTPTQLPVPIRPASPECTWGIISTTPLLDPPLIVKFHHYWLLSCIETSLTPELSPQISTCGFITTRWQIYGWPPERRMLCYLFVHFIATSKMPFSLTVMMQAALPWKTFNRKSKGSLTYTTFSHGPQIYTPPTQFRNLWCGSP